MWNVCLFGNIVRHFWKHEVCFQQANTRGLWVADALRLNDHSAVNNSRNETKRDSEQYMPELTVQLVVFLVGVGLFTLVRLSFKCSVSAVSKIIAAL